MDERCSAFKDDGVGERDGPRVAVWEDADGVCDIVVTDERA